jgi:hypothetical protein
LVYVLDLLGPFDAMNDSSPLGQLLTLADALY